MWVWVCVCLPLELPHQEDLAANERFLVPLQCFRNDIASGAMPCVSHAEVCCLRRSQANALKSPLRLFIDLHDHPSLPQGSPDGHLSLHAHPPIERVAEQLINLFGEAPSALYPLIFTTIRPPPHRIHLRELGHKP